MAKFARRRQERRSRREIGSAPSGFTQGVGADGPAPGAEQRAGGRLRLRNWRLRSKLAVVLLVPTITALALGGLRLQTELGLVDDYSQVRRQVELNSLVNGVLDNLQQERELAAGYAANDRVGNIAELGGAEQRTDAAVTNLRNWSGRTAAVKPEVRQRYRQALSRLDALDALRSTIQNNSYPDVALASSYTDITQYLVNLASSLSMSGFTDPKTAQAASALGDLANAKEQLAQRNTALIIAAVRKQFPPQQSTDLRSAKARYDAAIADFEAVADPDTRGEFTSMVAGPAIDKRNGLEQTALARSDTGRPVGVGVNDIRRAGEASEGQFRQLERDLGSRFDNRLASLQASARTHALRDGGVILGAVLLSLLIMLFVARSMLSPLRALRTNALGVASTRLPQAVQRILSSDNPVEASRGAVAPVPPFTTEEIGEVARSFDVVHDQAVRLAAEQALLRESVNAMFVNLSRRSQVLVERQLSLIDRLESDEQDPDQLSSLFELDHLATRMRRNSENLLVLAGTDIERRLTKPVPLSDVIGAAVSEIEHYARVEVSKAPDYLVAGSAVNDVVHLIAELLDNATVFSEPNTEVTVRAARRRTGELAIEVADRGVGIQEAELASINERLADPPELDVSVSRRMGLYVVGRLAMRHEIMVVLRENQDLDGGVVARVVIPRSLVRRDNARRSLDTSSSLLATTGADYVTVGGTGTFAAVPGEPDEGASPAMASNGIAGAFGINRPSNVAGSHPPAADAEPDEHMDEGHTEFGSDQEAAVAPFGDAHRPSRADETDLPTDRLPIYEEVLSQWFSTDPDRSPAGYRFAGDTKPAVADSDVQDTADSDEEVPEVTATDSGGPTTGPAASAPTSSGLPKRVPGRAAPERPAPEHAGPEHSAYAHAGEPPDTGGAVWRTPADSGWRAAEALQQPVNEMTTAGLPKRRPKAHLVPGSAAPRPAESTQPPGGATPASEPGNAPALVPRSADAVRGRMSSLQQGVRRGRHALVEEHGGDAPGTGALEAEGSEAEHDSDHSEPRHDEEQA